MSAPSALRVEVLARITHDGRCGAFASRHPSVLGFGTCGVMKRFDGRMPRRLSVSQEGPFIGQAVERRPNQVHALLFE